MPGFAINSTSSQQGFAKSVLVENVGGETSSTIFTATKKTRITSLVAVNKTYGILPLTIVAEVGEEESIVVMSARVWKQKHLVLSTVGDASVPISEDVPRSEIVLLPGDSISASSPIENSFDLSLVLYEGIS
jgi:hypothetical protein